jgi:hypothetical protein
MDCNAYRILITGYIDEELSHDEMQTLKTHLQTCKSCYAYLIRAEAMKTVLKRCRLLQEVPEVPQEFAHNISAILQETTTKEKISLGAKVSTKYRELVLGIVDKWRSSLKTRPFAWMTSVSFCVLLLAGVVFVDVFRTVYEENSGQSAKISPKPVMQIAQKNRGFNERSPLQPPAVALDSEKRSETEGQEIFDNEPIRFAEEIPLEPTILSRQQDKRMPAEEANQLDLLETSGDQVLEDMDVLQFDEVSFKRVVAKGVDASVEGYVYSHVIEVSQELFIDDAVFVGYVQNASFE